MKFRQIYIGITKSNMNEGETREDTHKTKDNRSKQEVLFTIPQIEFDEINDLLSIECDIAEANIYDIEATIKTTKKIDGQHPIYAITLEIPTYKVLPSGMQVLVNIYSNQQSSRLNYIF